MELSALPRDAAQECRPIRPQSESDCPSDLINKLANNSLPRLRLVVGIITNGKQLMHEKHQKIQDDEVETKILLAMTEVVLTMEAMVLQNAERLVLNA